MGYFGPDYNLNYWGGGMAGLNTSGAYGRVRIGWNSANEQGLVIYGDDLVTVYGVLRTPPGLDDPNGALLRAGTRLLRPGTYWFGGFGKFGGAWRWSRVGTGTITSPTPTSPSHYAVRWDDVTRLNSSGFYEYDGDYDDLILQVDLLRGVRPIVRNEVNIEGPNPRVKTDLEKGTTDISELDFSEMNLLGGGGTDPIGI